MFFFPFRLFAQLGPADIDALPATEPTAIVKYGADALQFGELRLPKGKGAVSGRGGDSWRVLDEGAGDDEEHGADRE